MAKSRAEREAEFKARFGVSSGTYYAMRRQAESRGISNQQFDILARKGDYDSAKIVTQIAKDDRQAAKALADIFEGKKRLPGSKGSDKRRKAIGKLAKLWRKKGGKVSGMLGAIGSPPKRAKVAKL